MKGHLIIGKNNSFYNINKNLIKVNIRGNNNRIINPHKIIDLYINGNNNTIEIIRGGKIINIKVFGNNNEIHIKNNSQTNYFDQGIGNSLIRNNSIPIHRPIPNNNSNNLYLPINFQPINIQNRIDNIMNKLEEYSYCNISEELKNENKICSLCWEDFMNNEKIKIFSCKQHIFHFDCLKDYIQKNIDSPKCPICDENLNTNININPSLNINARPFISRHNDLTILNRDRMDAFDSIEDNRLNNFRFINLSDRIRNLFERIDEIRLHLNSGKKGLDKNILDNMEISKIKDIDKLDGDKKKCTICLENYVNGDDSIALPCIHIFHANCIKIWLKENNSCPICKNEIKYENEEVNDNEEF